MTIEEKIKQVVRNVPDFPKPGINFKDISTILMDHETSNAILNTLVEKYADSKIDKIAGIESRGFLFGYALAMRLNKPFVLIRKEGKLPFDKIKHNYDLEYGSATIEIHTDAIKKGDKVLIHDDLLATGGSAAAAAKLIQKLDGEVSAFNFIIELSFLNGKEKLQQYTKNIVNLASY
ncbi:MAG: adenine phosphoribosyltransferase [Crocinitomicaceae bacterium]|nr:adenine phosphoribosyltransferase [Crocinitomicaceae bacterium]